MGHLRVGSLVRQRARIREKKMNLPPLAPGVLRPLAAKLIHHRIGTSVAAAARGQCNCNWTCSGGNAGHACGPPGSKKSCLKECAGNAERDCKPDYYVATYSSGWDDC